MARGKNFIWLAEDTRILRKMAGEYPVKAIAEVIGCKYYTVKWWAKKLGIPLRLYGEKAHNAKYSDVTIEWIRRSRDEGYSIPRIARDFNISPHYVRQIVDYRVRPKDIIDIADIA